MEIVIDILDRAPGVAEAVGDQSKVDLRLIRLIRGSIAEVTDGKNIYACGITVAITEVASADFLLPAILLAAAETLKLSATTRKGKGGFAFHMRADEKALLTFKVSHIEVSSPRALILSIMDVVRNSERGGEYILDDHITRFGDFVRDDLQLEPQTGEDIKIAIRDVEPNPKHAPGVNADAGA
jgi:hypothetical protein